MTNSRVTRGRATESLVRDWFIGNGAPDAKRRPASLPGTDVYDIPGLAIEVKATSGDMTGALKQAVRNAQEGELPLVVWRPAGYGPERMSQWPVVMTLRHMTDLLVMAGLLHP